jgi:hypothetical protein
VSDELVTADVPLTGEVRAFLTECTRLYAAGDDDRLLDEWFTDDYCAVDHRMSGGSELKGREEARHYLRTTRLLLPDFRIAIHVVALDGSTYVARDTYDGNASLGGGDELIQWWVVDRLRDGRLAREDIYETEDEARAEFERLTAA